MNIAIGNLYKANKPRIVVVGLNLASNKSDEEFDSLQEMIFGKEGISIEGKNWFKYPRSYVFWSRLEQSLNFAFGTSEGIQVLKRIAYFEFVDNSSKISGSIRSDEMKKAHDTFNERINTISPKPDKIIALGCKVWQGMPTGKESGKIYPNRYIYIVNNIPAIKLSHPSRIFIVNKEKEILKKFID